MIKEHDISIDLFDLTVKVFIFDEDDVEEIEEKLDDSVYEKKALTCCIGDKLEVYFHSEFLVESVVVHECYHLLKAIKRHIGFDDEETEAYLIEWLFKKIKDLK
jgi:hypothetical protein